MFAIFGIMLIIGAFVVVGSALTDRQRRWRMRRYGAQWIGEVHAESEQRLELLSRRYAYRLAALAQEPGELALRRERDAAGAGADQIVWMLFHARWESVVDEDEGDRRNPWRGAWNEKTIDRTIRELTPLMYPAAGASLADAVISRWQNHAAFLVREWPPYGPP